MEKNPVACLQNNVLGTETVASAAESCGVGDFVLVSTDKAVRPTSLMGASKRLAERVVVERPESATRFKAVRFGNVLGSSGSVIPIFREQIKRGGPLTVTSKEVTRYFMTIPEAVELVIAAGAVSEDRSICVLEMGDPVKIDSLARRMIALSGLVPDVDIKIEYTGLRPGEKEYEELITDDEGVVRTDHDRIWVVEKSHEVDAPPLDLGKLKELLDEGVEGEIRRFAHKHIPGSLLMD
jgi:FlaA1/EpsC-like NDP-sugar epimerase